MSMLERRTPPAGTASPVQSSGHGRHGGGHGWMMIACCIPMLAIAVALVATGVVSPGFLLFAVVCTAAMALMMHGMHGGGDNDQFGDDQPPAGRSSGR